MALLDALMPAALGNVTFINNLLLSAGVAVATVADTLQTGGSNLGVLPPTILPPFLGGPGHDSSAPWINNYTGGTDDRQIPDTGVTRYYDLHVSRKLLAPDGVEKDMIVVNGQFPGPLLEANWGDFFHITVHNDIENPQEGTTLHWHGLRQTRSPWFDGVPSVQQCPIAPGSSLVYHFQADLFGTSWYHSHFTAQYADGVFGPMVIYGPSSAPYDIDLGPLMVSDIYHQPYTQVVANAMSVNPALSQTTFADATLMNGKMKFDCSTMKSGQTCHQGAAISKFQFQAGKVHRLRLINSSSFATVLVAIDGHNLTVIANDFVPVQPYTVQQVVLAPGQRNDVLVTGMPSPPSINNAYFIRARQPLACTVAYQPFALAAVYYKGAPDTNARPLSLPQPEFVAPRLLNCGNDPLDLTVPAFQQPAATPDTTYRIDITQSTNATGNLLYKMNGQSFRGNYNEPILRLLQAGNVSYPDSPEWNVVNFGTNATIRLVIQNHVPFSHPMHIHGQNMMVLDEGVGEWDGKTIIRPQNPQRRDTQLLQPSGYLVIQLTSDNPGVWPFHCHFAWHVTQGLYVNIVQRPGDIPAMKELPGIVAQSCDAWDSWSDSHFVDQIDSGVKRERE